MSEARKLADDMGTEVCGLLLGGKGVGEKMAKELGAYGADKVLVCESDLLETYTTDAYAKVLCDTVMAKKPEILLIAATNIGRDLGPRCAARLHTGLTADCTHLDVDVEKYAAFLQDASTLPQAQMATVRPGVLKKGEYNEAKANAVVVEPVAFELSEADIKTKVLEVVKEAKELVDLTGAEVVVSVGRGISKDVETGIKLAEELAGLFGGVVGGSRAAIDSGWLSADHQVGQTGKTVHPKLYVALGISGAIQHKAGMQDSECIVAVNKSDSAPIFDVADYGICGDLFKVTPMLIEAIKAAKAAK